MKKRLLSLVLVSVAFVAGSFLSISKADGQRCPDGWEWDPKLKQCVWGTVDHPDCPSGYCRPGGKGKCVPCNFSQ